MVEPEAGSIGPPPVVAMGGVCVIFDAADRVLLVRHTYGRHNWELPGGGSEPGESPEETAVREVREETALDVSIDRLTGVYFEPDPRPGSGQAPLLHFVFRARRLDAREPVAMPPEIGDVGYWPLDALPTPISDFTELRILDAARGEEATVRRIGNRRWRV